MKSSANWFGLQIDTISGLRTLSGPGSWQITQIPRFGVQIGIVWGPIRRPYSFYGKNPWLEKADWVVRIPWVVLPWIHVWWWRKGDHPARIYIGGKLFFAHSRSGEDIWRDPIRDPIGWYVTPSASFRRG